MSKISILMAMFKRPVIIIGEGLHARYVADNLEAQDILVYGFMEVENSEESTIKKKRESKEIYDIPVLGPLFLKENMELLQRDETDFFIAVADANLRLSLLKQLYEQTKRFPITIIHPKAYVSRHCSYVAGNVIHAHSTLAPQVQMEALNYIGANVVLELGARLGSANTIEAGVMVGANTIIGDQNYIGAGTIILPGLTIGSGVIIEAGTIVKESIISTK
ncbi:MAG: hypothetical protein RML72_13120 [Bacteroidia bacterium]|nr:hypothetical protein [Bacteroidia bacterium]MDW8159800.1 hypothetical protein [Bacteroidia bacterium]